ncbi:MAG: HIT family protein [Alphaproteobacteria bacterium]|nr:HIT family protein [Alphaproteobacteria bacterium]MBL7096627.1 HIT family protein [Alphaproteobacteria bacterium]
MFDLHPRLAADTAFVADWAVSRVLLMDDARYRWIVLVPRVANAVELHDLTQPDRAVLLDEIVKSSERLKRLAVATKINVGALGNLVPQLHVHVVARSPRDPAWPGPVWGHSSAVPYERPARDAFIREFLNAH